jgi:cytidylate kinase
MAIEGIDRPTAERRLARIDRFRRAYLEDLYGVDVHEPGLVHLTLDSTAISLDACVEIIAAAAVRR